MGIRRASVSLLFLIACGGTSAAVSQALSGDDAGAPPPAATVAPQTTPPAPTSSAPVDPPSDAGGPDAADGGADADAMPEAAPPSFCDSGLPFATQIVEGGTGLHWGGGLCAFATAEFGSTPNCATLSRCADCANTDNAPGAAPYIFWTSNVEVDGGAVVRYVYDPAHGAPACGP